MHTYTSISMCTGQMTREKERPLFHKLQSRSVRLLRHEPCPPDLVLMRPFRVVRIHAVGIPGSRQWRASTFTP